METPIEFDKMSLEQIIPVVKELVEQNAALKDKLVVSEAKLEETKNELDTTIEINNELSAKVSELSSKSVQPTQPAAATKAVLPTDTFKVDNVVYGFAFPKISTKDHGVITAQEVLVSEMLQRYLVGVGSGMVRKV